MGFFGSTDGANDTVDEVEIIESEGQTISEVLGQEVREEEIPTPKEATEETDSLAKEKLSDLAEKTEEEPKMKDTSKKKSDVAQADANDLLEVVVIPDGVTVAGNITVTNGDLCIAGNLSGSAEVDGNVSILGSRVTSDITCHRRVIVDTKAKLVAKQLMADESVEVYGAVKAEIKAKKVVLYDDAVVSGSISCENIDIADHAKLKGSVSIVGGNEEDIDSMFD